jgi:myo-inositol-1(or 4)-monophosphatase
MVNTLEFSIELAREAGQLLCQRFQHADLKTSIKADRTVVTQADIEADDLIAAAIRRSFPQDVILSEELQPGYDASPDGAVWVIDPIDGTTNFSLGLPVWGSLIARVVQGVPQTTAMFFPLLDELYSAERGQGAFLNGDRITTQPPSDEKPYTFFSCCSRTHRSYQVSVPYKTRILGSAAYTFCSVARGIAVIGFEAAPKIWDIAGGWLLVEEAGGVVETLDGSRPFPLLPGMEYARQNFPTISAASPEVAHKARTWIRPR